MAKNCRQHLRIGRIRALNGCAGRPFGAATLHKNNNSYNKSNRKSKELNTFVADKLSTDEDVILGHLL